MLNLFVGPEREGVGIVRLLAKYRGTAKASSQLFQPVDVPVREIFKIVDSIDQADAILFPHDYGSVLQDAELIAAYEKLAADHNKKIIVFSFSDRDIFVKVQNAIVLRTSAYRYKLQPNEIIAAPFIEDVGAGGVSFRNKQEKPPTIGFVGMASWPNIFTCVSAQVHRMLLLLQSVISNKRKTLVHMQGVFIRRKAIRVLKKSKCIRPLLIIRNTFSGLTRTISLSPEKARDEYIQVMKESDLCLAPKGDGNYSLRFFEALSLGRIPVIIDTDMVFPFEDKITYDDVIVRIKPNDIGHIDVLLAGFYRNISNEEFILRQKKARQIFEDFLKPEKFYSILFEKFATQFHSG